MTPCSKDAQTSFNRAPASFNTYIAEMYPKFKGDIPGYAKELAKLGYNSECPLAFMHVGD